MGFSFGEYCEIFIFFVSLGIERYKLLTMNKLKGILLVFTLLVGVSVRADRVEMEQAGMKLSQFFFYLDNLYVDTVDLGELAEKAIVKVLEELDPHSAYIAAEDVAEMNQGIQGNFEGIGISYQFIKDTVVVNQTIAGCPAEKVGMLPGDRLTHVDTVCIAGVGKKQSEIPKLIRGEKGSKVKVRVVRRGEKEPIEFMIVRDKIPIHSVDAAFYVADGVGYIKLNSFSVTTTDEIAQALNELQNEGELKSLVLDLQSNGGGVMSAAIELVNLFLLKDRLIVYTEGVHQERFEAVSFGGKKLIDLPLYVLIDEHSASASEIVSGALQDWDRATIVGRRSFGKGLVQRPLRMKDGSEIRLTTSRYYTPSGRNIQKPYNAGKEAYYKDLERRYEHGEMVNSDSVVFPDSLKYKTLVEGRTVYGGGGIFPDVFVPLDTTRVGKFHRNVVAKGVFNRTVSEYTDRNRKELTRKYKTFEEFEAGFELSEKVYERLIENAREEKIEMDMEDVERCKRLLMLQMKAVVAQGLFGTEAFYRVMYIENDALIKTLDIIK